MCEERSYKLLKLTEDHSMHNSHVKIEIFVLNFFVFTLIRLIRHFIFIKFCFAAQTLQQVVYMYCCINYLSSQMNAILMKTCACDIKPVK
jgi:hypothetical protein